MFIIGTEASGAVQFLSVARWPGLWGPPRKGTGWGGVSYGATYFRYHFRESGGGIEFGTGDTTGGIW